MPRPSHRATGRGDPPDRNTRLTGRGFYPPLALADPQAQCKGRSDPFTEISSDAPTTPRFGPLSLEDRARRVAELRMVCVAPTFQARGSVPGNGGSSRELPHIRVPTSGHGPADRTGGESARGPNARRASPSPPSPTTSPPTPALAHRFAGAGGPALSPGPTPAAGPADNSIADRVHRHPGTVRRSLRHLEDLGYIQSRRSSRENPTGRLIHLTCREPDWERPRRALTKHGAAGGRGRRSGGSARRIAEGDVVVRRIEKIEIGTPGTITIGSSPPGPWIFPPRSRRSRSRPRFPPRPPPRSLIPPSPSYRLPPRPQSWYLRNPSLHHCERSGLGHEQPTLHSEHPSAWSLSAPSPHPGSASLLLTPELSVAARPQL